MGETGGKNFHFVHPSADVETVINQVGVGCDGMVLGFEQRDCCPGSLLLDSRVIGKEDAFWFGLMG